jgi:hypothetical protein
LSALQGGTLLRALGKRFGGQARHLRSQSNMRATEGLLLGAVYWVLFFL